MAASRTFLVLALVAMLCAGAVAERQLLKSSSGDKADKADKADKSGKSGYGGKGGKGISSHSCKKQFPGCKTCGYESDDDDSSVTCTTCWYANTVFDGEACICDSDEGYGLLPKGWKAGKKGSKGSKGSKSDKSGDKKTKHAGAYGKCVYCEDYGYLAEEGKCILLE